MQNPNWMGQWRNNDGILWLVWSVVVVDQRGTQKINLKKYSGSQAQYLRISTLQTGMYKKRKELEGVGKELNYRTVHSCRYAIFKRERKATWFLTFLRNAEFCPKKYLSIYSGHSGGLFCKSAIFHYDTRNTIYECKFITQLTIPVQYRTYCFLFLRCWVLWNIFLGRTTNPNSIVVVLTLKCKLILFLLRFLSYISSPIESDSQF